MMTLPSLSGELIINLDCAKWLLIIFILPGKSSENLPMVITDQYLSHFVSHFNTEKSLQKGLCIEFHSWFINFPVGIPSICNQRGGGLHTRNLFTN